MRSVTWRTATAARSRTSVRHRIIKSKVRSTSRRRGKTLKTGSVVRRRTTSMAKLKERRLIREMGAAVSGSGSNSANGRWNMGP
jgi:hypothetical protein